MELALEVKKIGNSIGVIIPKKLAENMGITPGEKIIVDFRRKSPKDLFGILKGIELDPTKAKVFREDEEW